MAAPRSMPLSYVGSQEHFQLAFEYQAAGSGCGCNVQLPFAGAVHLSCWTVQSPSGEAPEPPQPQQMAGLRNTLTACRTGPV